MPRKPFCLSFLVESNLRLRHRQPHDLLTFFILRYERLPFDFRLLISLFPFVAHLCIPIYCCRRSIPRVGTDTRCPTKRSPYRNVRISVDHTRHNGAVIRHGIHSIVLFKSRGVWKQKRKYILYKLFAFV